MQTALFDDTSPAAEWDRKAAERALDDLFNTARRYKTSQAYRELMTFISGFRFYSPFNALLVHIQMPGASYVAPGYRWRYDFGRQIKADARPLVILQPMGPVMFVFDVSQTEPGQNAVKLPPEVERPFKVRQGVIRNEYTRSVQNSVRDGVEVIERDAGSQSAGAIQYAKPGKILYIMTKAKPKPEYVPVPLQYEVLVNASHSIAEKYATLAHELAHLYCGHLGTPNEKWWPDRRGVAREIWEFEAESVCYLVCKRMGIDNPSERYMADQLNANNEIPPISLDCVLKAVGLIERMSRERLQPRKQLGEDR